MSTEAWTALSIFLIVYVFIVSEKIHRTVIALLGAMAMIICGVLTQEQAIHHIDFNTIGLLAGMMVVVNITGETGLFNFLAIWSAKKVKAEPVKLLLALSLLTAVCSAFLDNVTTVLLTVPLTFSITSQLNLPVYPFLFSQILSSNIGGTATLIGDPPNIMIGSAVKELSFFSFIENLGVVCTIIFIITMVILVLWYKKDLKTKPELQASIMQMDPKTEIKDSVLLKKCLGVLFAIIFVFFIHGELHLESATVALAGAAVLMLITMHNHEAQISAVLSKVEWLAIFFFAGLFILVGGLVETGIIKLLAGEMLKLTAGEVNKASALILWLSAIASAFVDNIPFVATLIPMIKDMGAMGMTNLEPLWWSLSLGACLGGNGTLIGASANVVVASMAALHGKPISFVKYMKGAFPLMILSILIANIFIWLVYFE